jgi:hypothetical protein
VRGTLIKFRNLQIRGTGRLDSFIGYQISKENAMFYHGHFTHPDLWMMWFAVIGTAVNALAVAYMVYKEIKR